MRFFNYRFCQRDGISKSNWNPYTMIDWKQQGLPFIQFGTRVDFGQHHPECFPDYNMLRIRVGNWRLTLHFHFVNCEFDEPIVYGESITQALLPFWNSPTITAKQVIENIKQLTGK